MKCIFLDFDRTLFDTELFYNSLELQYVFGMQRFREGVDFRKFIYPDVISGLFWLKNEGFTICLITFGERAVQEYKFEASGLSSYFDEKFYVEHGSKAEVIEKYLNSVVSCEKVIFVDDTLSHLEDFVQLIPYGVAIRMKRKGAKGSEVEDNHLTSITTLQDLQLVM